MEIVARSVAEARLEGRLDRLEAGHVGQLVTIDRTRRERESALRGRGESEREEEHKEGIRVECRYCDGPGGPKTYENQVSMPIEGRVECIDFCIHRIVAGLNAGGVGTTSSCCGHGGLPGRIDLEDGRILAIVTEEDYAELTEKRARTGMPRL